MIFGLFKKSCPICGMKIKKEEAITKSGKYFCSEDHAKKYFNENQNNNSTKNHGCCHK